jgi:hypothetical protein
MTTRNALRVFTVAATCLAPLIAFAEDPPAAAQADVSPPASIAPPLHGDIQIDVGGVMGQNPNQAGRYTGLNTNGLDTSISEINLLGRAPWNSGDARFYELSGNNLTFQTGDHLGTGLDRDSNWASGVHNGLANNGSLEFKAGVQGAWQIGAYYDAITYTGNVIDSLYNINGNVVMLNNGLAPWGGATATKAGAVTAFTIPQLAATKAMLPFQTGTRRDIIGGDFKYILNEWTFTGAIRHEHKEGSMEESFDGPYGGTAFALPINYDTDRYDLTAAYTTPRFQGMIQYTFSHFSDNTNFIALPYPTSNTAAPFQRSAAYSTPPSNDAHYLTFQAATDAVPLTRINVNARVGLEVQNDEFAPNTADPNPAGATGFGSLNPHTLEGTTTSSPDMMAEVYQLKLSAASHPFTDVTTRIYYGLDGRSVSLNQYQVNTGGTGGSSDSSLAGLAFVVPQDWLKQNTGAEVGYRFLPESDTKLTVGYRLDAVDRSNAQVGHSATNTGTVALSSELGSQVNGKLSFDYADRTGSLSYLTPWINLDGLPSATPTYSGAYYQAPMTSEAVTMRVDYMPLQSLTTEFFLQFKNENYSYPAGTNYTNPAGTVTIAPLSGAGAGVKQDYALTVGPDFNYRPTTNTNFHAFYTYELLFFNNLGNGACSTVNTGTCAGSAGYFQNNQTSGTHTVGLSGEWQVNEKLKLRAEYTFSYGTVMFGEYNGVFVSNPTLSYQNVSNYPDINSLMNNIRMSATYELWPNLDLILVGTFTSFHNNDWDDTANAIQGAGTTAISILTPGYNSPNYNVAAVMAGVKFRF